MGLRTTYTYATLEIGPEAFDHILTKIHAAGADYVERYFDEDEEQRIIHFPGSEVALVTPKKPVKEPGCKCQGFYQPPDCPVHGIHTRRSSQG